VEVALGRVLIVEDDHALQRSLQRALEQRFAAVRACGTRAEASELIAGWRPELVLLDVMLPDGDAFDVLRDAARGAPLPQVVAMSGAARAHLAEALRRLGVRAFLVKPLTPETLDRALDEALAVSPARRETPPAAPDRRLAPSAARPRKRGLASLVDRARHWLGVS
jgi:CheY-like chemotaxis protein